MAGVSLKLTAFEGPLDLLLHLIEKDKIDIYDIPIVSVTEQYISYLRNLKEFDMELASQFLVMAATLLQIKSRMLLPKEMAEEPEEEEDPRRQLVEMLVEYRRIKKAAAELAAMKAEADRMVPRRPMFADLSVRVLPGYGAAELLRALAGMLAAGSRQEAYIRPQSYSVQDKMAEVLNLLQKKKNGIMFSELLADGSAGEKIASFLGVLELLHMGLITISQSAQFAPIYIFSRQGEEKDAVQ